jgi:hypothetical protein
MATAFLVFVTLTPIYHLTTQHNLLNNNSETIPIPIHCWAILLLYSLDFVMFTIKPLTSHSLGTFLPLLIGSLENIP